jgi:DNA (cytosine-5)-methyltransferase 1
VPAARLAWASFPCQDLSLAGAMRGIRRGARSSLFWEWLRVLDEMGEAAPPVVVAENVVGFLSSDNSNNFKAAYRALKERGFLAGALAVDAVHFVPQSRPRAFLVAARRGADLAGLCLDVPPGEKSPSPWHSASVLAAAWAVADPEWIWWRLPPPPPARARDLAGVIDFDAPIDPPEKTEYLMSLLSPTNRRKLDAALGAGGRVVGAGYRRVRVENGVKRQRLELRFDGVAGCLRTPAGGSSRQVFVIVEDGEVKTRLLAAREAARLMGAPENFKLPGSYNAAYKAMGDAVAVPVARWLAEHLLAPLVARATRPATPSRSAKARPAK